MSSSNVELARRGFEALRRGELAEISALLGENVRWHAGDPNARDACQNRRQALAYMQRPERRGPGELVEVLDAGDRVVVITRPPPDEDGRPTELHAQITTFRDGKVTEMVGYPTVETALAAAGVEWQSPDYQRNPGVDEYINALPEWQQDLCRRLRDLIHAADPEITETIKRTVRPYFVRQGNVCALLAAKDHVNLFLYDGGIVPDPEAIITGGHTNKTARTISFHQGHPINERALTTMLRQIAQNNRAGGWRQLKGS